MSAAPKGAWLPARPPRLVDFSLEGEYTIQLPRVPSTLQRAAIDHETPGGLIEVSPRSPLRLRRCVETFARYFRREFRYDFVQYSALEPGAANERAYLWMSRNAYPPFFFGAASFRWRAWKDAAPGFALQWVWLHPYERRRGYLTRAWPAFRAQFGDFHCERPLSPAMAAFLRKLDPHEEGDGA